MQRPDDELDNLFRHHLAGQIDPVRGQARRAFDREVTRPMRDRLRRDARRQAVGRVTARARRLLPMALAMAACTALGFYLPRWSATPQNGVERAEVMPPVSRKSSASSVVGAPHLADYAQTVYERHEDRGPDTLPDGTPGLRVRHSRVESAHYVDPRTQARTEYLHFPPEQEDVYAAARQ